MIRNKVLFSPIGRRDPFSKREKNEMILIEDGPMLHIVKQYAPSKVYLYLTKEMIDKGKRKECETAIKDFDSSIEVIANEYSNVENPADFDGFYTAFSAVISSIREENPHSDILLNVSSGTTQMTSMLCVEVLTNKEELFPIQAEDPGYNPNPNRCKEPGLLGLRKSVFKLQITDMLNKWDYTGAYSLLMSSKVRFSERLEALLQHGYCRSVEQSDMAFKIAENELKDIFVKLYPCMEKKKRKVIDYYNVLALKRERGEITDFTLRAYTCAESLIVIDDRLDKILESLSVKSDKGKKEWDLDKAKLNHPELISWLKDEGHDFCTGFTSFTLARVAEYFKVTGYELLFNDSARKFRNNAAHDMAPITEDMLLTRINASSLDIQNAIKECIERIYNPPPESFEIFRYINSEIFAELD